METTTGPNHGSPSRWERLALGSGVLFGVAQLAALIFAMAVVVPTHAPVDAPPAETAGALARHATLIALGTYLTALPLPFFLVFLAGVFGVLRRVEGGGDVPAVAAVAAGVSSAVTFTLGALLSGLAGSMAQLGGDPAIVKEIDSITPLAMALAALPNAVFVGTLSAVALQAPFLPRWLAWSGMGLVVLCLAASATIALRGLFPLALLATLLFPLWALAVSVALLRGWRGDELPGDSPQVGA